MIPTIDPTIRGCPTTAATACTAAREENAPQNVRSLHLQDQSLTVQGLFEMVEAHPDLCELTLTNCRLDGQPIRTWNIVFDRTSEDTIESQFASHNASLYLTHYG